MSRLRAMFAAIACFAAVGGFAADDNTIITPGTARADSPGKAAGATFGSTTLILGVLVGSVGAWMVWRNRRGTPVGRDNRALAVEESRSLGNRQFLVVASYEGKKFLLGVCPGRIDLLSPLDGSGSREKSRE